MTEIPAKPSFLKPIPANIPEALRAFPQWVNWRGEWVEGTNGKPGRWTKVPYQPNGYKADKTNPAHWSDFSEVIAAYEDSEGDFDGIGFVLTENDPFTALDLDHCVTDGIIVDPVKDIIRQMNSYTEFSPSGHGIRIFVKGQLARNKRQDKAEVYSHRSYVSVTDHIIGDLA